MIKVGSLFAGVGGICLGFKQAGTEIIWANEIDKNACLTYTTNFGNNYLLQKDITLIDKKEIPNIDILTAGFPCQAFSIAGYRKGFSDERGNLFFEVLKTIQEKKPNIIFLENVKNLLTHDNNKTFSIIKQSLKEEGYFLHYKILNAMEYGNLPQNRERIYIVGFLNKEQYDKFIFPEKENLTNTIDILLNKQEKQEEKYYYKVGKFFNMLQNSIINKNSIYQIRRQYIRENKKGVCPTLTANMGLGGHNVPIVVDNFGIRKLTPKECFKLQGFPEDYILPSIANSHLYKQAGNSVSVPVIRKIAENILKTY